MPKPPRNDKVLYWDSDLQQYVLLPAPNKARWGLKRQKRLTLKYRSRAGDWRDVRKA